jgi:hypothetical protein
LIIAILTRAIWNINVILIFICFIAKDVEHFLICLLAIYTCSFENCLVNLNIYSVGCWFFERLVFWAPCIIWLWIPCQMCSWQKFSTML